ncbi:HAMP domain-containing protein [Gracilimonas sp.]|uniref:HAMP domain-containing protein n=1 Tax=Gracilimonas sp. TaxID=1974203 RepID=UPI0028711FCF|nr:HAMP domain-containing protein [Gracilimonas sp.]
MTPLIKNKTWFVASLLVFTALGYGLYEITASQSALNNEELNKKATESVTQALQRFSEFESDFLSQSNALFSDLREELSDNPDTDISTIPNTNEDDFWGISVFKGDELILWNGFGPAELSIDSAQISRPHTEVARNNNITYLRYTNSFVIQRDTAHKYILVTRKKIQQENVLPIGRNSELTSQSLFQSPSEYPVRFSFFDTPPENSIYFANISTHSVDSAGVIYALQDDLSDYNNEQQNKVILYRAVFYALLIVLIALFLIFISQRLDTWRSLFVKLFALLIAWLFFTNINFEIGWTQTFNSLEQERISSIKPLIHYGIHALFILLITLSSYTPLSNNDLKLSTPPFYLSSAILGLSGFFSATLFYFFLTETYTLFYETSIPVLDLEIFPSIITLSFYVLSSVFVTSLILLIFFLNRFLFQLFEYVFPIKTIITFAGFFTALMFHTYLGAAPLPLLVSIIALIYFSLLIALLWTKEQGLYSLANTSFLRKLFVFSLFAVGITYIGMYNGYSDRLDEQMEQAAEEFANQEESQADRIVRELLINLEQSMSPFSSQNLMERPEFAERIFNQQIQSLIPEEWKSFSISAQLINDEGETISEYSSNIDSPAWTKAFNMQSLIIPFQMEQISINNLIPIVRKRPLNESNSNYSTFRRAWIPLYQKGENPERLGWILCSVYQERPQHNKPLRAVIASQENSNWNAPISITEFIDQQSARKNVVGTPIDLPGYSRLPETLYSQIQEDSLLHRISQFTGQSFRELFIIHDDNQIIRSATKHPEFANHLFAFMRFYFSIFLFGLLVLWIIKLRSKLEIIGTGHRFRDRLIDQFTLASLTCLIVLIGATYYGVKHQTQNTVQDQLLSKLNNLTEVISSNLSENADLADLSLNELTSTIDADASIYQNKAVLTSTTEQVYSQHVLPNLLPWDVYESIFERGNNQVTRKTKLGNQELLIGYQPWFDGNNDIAGVISIPTFLEAPKFNEQLLATTSYLLGFYVLIFGLFILGATLISRKLTAPLEALRTGLKQISGGDLETTLPVKSEDEIGSLTQAYNTMVHRLQDVQKELAKA